MLAALLALVPVVALAALSLPVEDDRWTHAYDRHFRKYTKHYFGPNVDWRWFKAQGIVESGLKANVRSAVGAKGVMQILPTTFAEIKRSNPHLSRIDNPRWNIAGAIYYDREMYRKWQDGLPIAERLKLAFASYNAGLGGIQKAYSRAEKRRAEVHAWKQVAPYAPGQTRVYVLRIERLMRPAGLAEGRPRGGEG